MEIIAIIPKIVSEIGFGVGVKGAGDNPFTNYGSCEFAGCLSIFRDL